VLIGEWRLTSAPARRRLAPGLGLLPVGIAALVYANSLRVG